MKTSKKKFWTLSDSSIKSHQLFIFLGKQFLGADTLRQGKKDGDSSGIADRFFEICIHGLASVEALFHSGRLPVLDYLYMDKT